MSKQVCAMDDAEDDYWYRFDTLEGLRYRADDGAFRARVGQLEGPFVHEQVVEMQQRSGGSPVYRSCFWNSLDEALRQASLLSFSAFVILQRVSRAHSFFGKFSHDADEYLPTSATIFYGTDTAAEHDPEFSGSAIPHADIEYMTRDGSWECLAGAQIIHETMPKEWTPFWLRGIHERPAEIWARHHPSDPVNPGNACILIRQAFQRDVSLCNSDYDLERLVKSLLSSTRAPAGKINFYLAVDFRGYPHEHRHLSRIEIAIEVPIWLRPFRAYLSVPFMARHGKVTVACDYLDLKWREVLYRHFLIEDRIEGDARWRVDFAAVRAMSN